MASTITVDTPDGPFTIIAEDDVVLASGWTDDVARLLHLIHPGLRPGTLEGVVDAGLVALVEAYYDGDPTAPSRAAVKQRSGEFRMRAWDVLRDVPPGEPISYAEFATRIGNPRAVRAAASACATNAAALFVPCHRVLRSDGTLGGFGYGLGVKRSLLERELNARP